VWRHARIGTQRNQLDHWATVVVGAVCQGDPLAYGIDRLSAARTTITADLRRIETGLPPDRRPQLALAEADLRRLTGARPDAAAANQGAAARLAEASRRRFRAA
jgi:hypothetical protein